MASTSSSRLTRPNGPDDEPDGGPDDGLDGGPKGRETPLRRQWEGLRAQHPRCLLLFQLGDFYECFEEDARVLARVCGVTLTSKELGKNDRVPLAGVPVTRLDYFLARLIEAGLHVAIAEQITPPGAGLVERVITRVVTPGTLAEPGLLREAENNYLAAVVPGRNAVGLAYADVTTGEFAVTQLAGDDAPARVRSEIERLAPAEVLVPDGLPLDLPPIGHRTICQAWRFAETTARERLCTQLGVLSLEGFGCAGLPLAVQAAGAILSYLEENNRRLLPSLVDLRTYSTAADMNLDAHTRRNLELLRNGRTGRIEGSLLSILDRTRTPMGGRLLRRWLGQPLLDLAEINARLDGVEAFVGASLLRGQVRALLGRVGDLERRVGRVVQGLAGPRELLDLAQSLRLAAQLADLIEGPHPPGPSPRPAWRGRGAGGEVAEDSYSPLQRAGEGPGVRQLDVWETPALIVPKSGPTLLDPCPDVADAIEAAISPHGGARLIRPGFSPELDALVATASVIRQRIAGLESAERQRTGIRSLKVGYNKIFGYYLEVTRPNLGLVPADYHRKQTLVQAERFITPCLKEWESEVTRAEERLEALERELFEALCRRVAGQATRLRRLAGVLAHLDVYASLADLADDRGYSRPFLDDGPDLTIRAARHPVVETRADAGEFIPNDCQLGPASRSIMVLTGPNMAGKSTFLREVALVVLLAQIGSFVPAREARVGLVDRIFTRVGAQDDISAGQSTFMVEMVETASILRHATARSLIILDEVGRGTSTYDGLSIARAVVEEIYHRIGARTLFATHFHELANLARELSGIEVFNVAVEEDGKDVVFLRTVIPGGAERSYGIQVARLAGLPPSVTERAERILAELEAGRSAPTPVADDRPRQLALDGLGVVAESPGEYLDHLLSLDLTTLTPLDALAKLWELHRRAGRR